MCTTRAGLIEFLDCAYFFNFTHRTTVEEFIDGTVMELIGLKLINRT